MCDATESIFFATLTATQTQRAASGLAKKIARTKCGHARVIALMGNLGAGKTTFVQGFARGLGVKEKIQSPTFVLMKIYSLNKQKNLKHMVHIDAYRLNTPAELEHLGLHDLLNDKDAVILVEWADRIKKLLPKDTVWMSFQHGDKANQRTVEIKFKNVKSRYKTQKSK